MMMMRCLLQKDYQSFHLCIVDSLFSVIFDDSLSKRHKYCEFDVQLSNLIDSQEFFNTLYTFNDIKTNSS